MTLDELEKTVAQLSPDQLAQFRDWFLAFDAANWDRQLETDIEEGRLDSLADAAIREHQSGGSNPL